MLQTERGSPDGGHVYVYQEGQEYDLSRTPRERELAEAFLRMGVATSNEPKAAPPVAPLETPAAPVMEQPTVPGKRGKR